MDGSGGVAGTVSVTTSSAQIRCPCKLVACSTMETECREPPSPKLAARMVLQAFIQHYEKVKVGEIVSACVSMCREPVEQRLGYGRNACMRDRARVPV